MARNQWAMKAIVSWIYISTSWPRYCFSEFPVIKTVQRVVNINEVTHFCSCSQGGGIGVCRSLSSSPANSKWQLPHLWDVPKCSSWTIPTKGSNLGKCTTSATMTGDYSWKHWKHRVGFFVMFYSLARSIRNIRVSGKVIFNLRWI